MVFSDLFFLFAFIPAFVLVYLLAGWIDKSLLSKGENRRHTLKNFVLIIFSLLFYAWGEPVYILLMLASVLVNYLAGILMDSRKSKGARKGWLIVGIVADICILGTFKYLNFFARVLNDLGLEVGDPKISLPIGISFYIFQSISYLVDVYRKESPAQKSYFGLLLYISMFPQLIAGPIVRYSTVAAAIHDRHVTGEDISEGIFRFIIGLGKKVIIANQLGEVATQFLANGLHDLSTLGAWVGLIAFSLQIYFDFSGYSDMAIGIGRCLGFHFNENFDHPYVSKTITEFWRRWHMSLGSFFRDYVYIPLGGNRKHQFLNIMAVWALTGLWHGASWNFVIWGLYFGIILTVEKFTIMRIKDKIPAPLLHLYALFIVTLGWGIFYFDNTSDIATLFHALFSTDHGLTDFAAENIIFEKFWLWIAALLFCMPIRTGVSKIGERVFSGGGFVRSGSVVSVRFGIAALLLLVSVCLLIGATNNAFLYTRF